MTDIIPNGLIDRSSHFSHNVIDT